MVFVVCNGISNETIQSVDLSQSFDGICVWCNHLCGYKRESNDCVVLVALPTKDWLILNLEVGVTVNAVPREYRFQVSSGNTCRP